MDRNQIALQCLREMIPDGGEKDDKVRAAFDFAELFVQESVLREQTRAIDELHIVVDVAKLREQLAILGAEVDLIDVIIQDLRGEL